MTLKKCPKCGSNQTTKNAVFTGRDGDILYFNCKQIYDGEKCDSTFILRGKNWKKTLESTASTIMIRGAA